MSEAVVAPVNNLTPAMRQYVDIKAKHPDCILFFRMGDFYEMFFEDARIASKLLNIALTSRGKDTDGSDLPMCGIPYFALESYLGKMVKSGQKVAICEQVEDPKLAKGVLKREVLRVVTPGTLTEDFLLNEKEASLLVAVCDSGEVVGLAMADLSTGMFTASEFTGEKRGALLLDELARLKPREILLHENGGGKNEITQMLKNSDCGFEELDFIAFDYEEARKRLLEQLETTTLEGFGLDDCYSAISAAGALIYYVKKTSPQALGAIKSIRWEHSTDVMEIDSASLKNLEILSNLSDGAVQGTLLQTLDKTETAMGARLLREWIVKPLKSKPAILKRQSLVTTFFEDNAACGRIRATLSKIGDFERAIGRIAGKNFNPRDFSSLLIALKNLPALFSELSKMKSDAMAEILGRWDSVGELCALLEKAVSLKHPATFRDTGFIRDGYNGRLDELRSFHKNSVDTIRDMEARERKATGIPLLKVGYNRIHGYYMEVTKKHIEKVPPEYIRKQTLVNAERYVSPELKELEEKLTSAEEHSKELEENLVEDLRGKTLSYLERVRTAAELTAKVDVVSSLAETARINDYCAPEISCDTQLVLEESRHPVIERLMTEESFVPNDLNIEEDSERLLIVTGPNMAGKSTYLRQSALAVLMAQMGGYVAAKSARVGIADRIFTRVGAHDRLQKGLSTFMVEMVETANILNNATEKSMIILDEIGRGTSTFDGVSIAWAVAEFLARLKARTIFATHYHELTDLPATQPGTANFNVSAKEYHDRLIFLRKLEPGPADKSYGIQVARLAGLPSAVLKRAKSVLRQLEKMEFGADGKPALKAQSAEEGNKGAELFGDEQVSLFDVGNHPVLNSLREADVNNMTPMDALSLIQRLKLTLATL